MATWNAIAATTKAILGLLEDGYPRELGTLAFAPIHLSDYTSEKSIPEGITLALYRVAVNGTSRNLPARLGPDGVRYRPSLPVDLQYLLTPWVADVETQQRLLGWAMRELEDHAVLPAGLLNRYLREPDVFRDDETVEILAEPIALADWSGLWDRLKPRLTTSATLVARNILIDSRLAVTEGPHVQIRRFEVARVAG